MSKRTVNCGPGQQSNIPLKLSYLRFKGISQLDVYMDMDDRFKPNLMLNKVNDK